LLQQVKQSNPEPISAKKRNPYTKQENKFRIHTSIPRNMLSRDEDRRLKTNFKLNFGFSVASNTSVSSEDFLPSSSVSYEKNKSLTRKLSRLAEMKNPSSDNLTTSTEAPQKLCQANRRTFFWSSDLSVTIPNIERNATGEIVDSAISVTPQILSNDGDKPTFEKEKSYTLSPLNQDPISNFESQTSFNASTFPGSKATILSNEPEINMKDNCEEHFSLNETVQQSELVFQKMPTLYQADNESSVQSSLLLYNQPHVLKSISRFRNLNLDSDGDTFLNKVKPRL